MKRKLPMIGILLNAFSIAACIVVFQYIRNMGVLSLPPEDNKIMIEKIKTTNDLDRLRNFSLEAQQGRVSASRVLNNQMGVLKEMIGYGLLFSSLNAGCFFLILRRTKESKC